MTSSFHDELVERAIVIDGHADLLGMLAEPQVLKRAVAALARPFSGAGVTKVVGLEARGSSSPRASRWSSALDSCRRASRGASIRASRRAS